MHKLSNHEDSDSGSSSSGRSGAMSPSSLSTTSSGVCLVSRQDAGSTASTEQPHQGAPRDSSRVFDGEASHYNPHLARQHRQVMVPTSIAAAQLQCQQQQLAQASLVSSSVAGLTGSGRKVSDNNSMKKKIKNNLKYQQGDSKLQHHEQGDGKKASTDRNFMMKMMMSNGKQHQQQQEKSQIDNNNNNKTTKQHKNKNNDSDDNGDPKKPLAYTLGKSFAAKLYSFDAFWSAKSIKCFNLACLLLTTLCLVAILSSAPFFGSSGAVQRVALVSDWPAADSLVVSTFEDSQNNTNTQSNPSEEQSEQAKSQAGKFRRNNNNNKDNSNDADDTANDKQLEPSLDEPKLEHKDSPNAPVSGAPLTNSQSTFAVTSPVPTRQLSESEIAKLDPILRKIALVKAVARIKSLSEGLASSHPLGALNNNGQVQHQLWREPKRNGGIATIVISSSNGPMPSSNPFDLGAPNQQQPDLVSEILERLLFNPVASALTSGLNSTSNGNSNSTNTGQPSLEASSSTQADFLLPSMMVMQRREPITAFVNPLGPFGPFSGSLLPPAGLMRMIMRAATSAEPRLERNSMSANDSLMSNQNSNSNPNRINNHHHQQQQHKNNNNNAERDIDADEAINEEDSYASELPRPKPLLGSRFRAFPSSGSMMIVSGSSSDSPFGLVSGPQPFGEFAGSLGPLAEMFPFGAAMSPFGPGLPPLSFRLSSASTQDDMSPESPASNMMRLLERTSTINNNQTTKAHNSTSTNINANKEASSSLMPSWMPFPIDSFDDEPSQANEQAQQASSIDRWDSQQPPARHRQISGSLDSHDDDAGELLPTLEAASGIDRAFGLIGGSGGGSSADSGALFSGTIQQSFGGPQVSIERILDMPSGRLHRHAHALRVNPLGRQNDRSMATPQMMTQDDDGPGSSRALSSFAVKRLISDMMTGHATGSQPRSGSLPAEPDSDETLDSFMSVPSKQSRNGLNQVRVARMRLRIAQPHLSESRAFVSREHLIDTNPSGEQPQLNVDNPLSSVASSRKPLEDHVSHVLSMVSSKPPSIEQRVDVIEPQASSNHQATVTKIDKLDAVAHKPLAMASSLLTSPSSPLFGFPAQHSGAASSHRQPRAFNYHPNTQPAGAFARSAQSSRELAQPSDSQAALGPPASVVMGRRLDDGAPASD